MTVSTTTNTVVSVGTAAPSTADTPTLYAADTYTAIKSVSDLGSIGDSLDEIKFQDMSAGRVTKLPGVRDGGDFEITVGYDALDPGQTAMRAAMADNIERAYKIEFPDKPNATGTDTIVYFRGRVTKVQTKMSVNSVVSTVFTVSVNTDLTWVPATTGA